MKLNKIKNILIRNRKNSTQEKQYFLLQRKFDNILLEDVLLIHFIKRSTLLYSIMRVNTKLETKIIEKNGLKFVYLRLKDSVNCNEYISKKELRDYLTALSLFSNKQDFVNLSNFYSGQINYFMKRNFIEKIQTYSLENNNEANIKEEKNEK